MIKVLIQMHFTNTQKANFKSWLFCFRAQDENRTRTSNGNKILSLARLPIPPPGPLFGFAKVGLFFNFQNKISEKINPAYSWAALMVSSIISQALCNWSSVITKGGAKRII